MKRQIHFSILIICIFFTCSKIFAQGKRANVWAFGSNAGIDFNNGGVPDSIVTAIGAFEGSASVCDDNGQLLFYTDGLTIWDRTHNPMPNAIGNLFGNGSSCQAAMITPVLNNPYRYYVFTVDGSSGWNPRGQGIYYTLVDMRLNNCNGDIDTSFLKIMTGKTDTMIYLTDSVDENVTAVHIPNSDEYWIVTKKYKKQQFYSFKVAATGVVSTPQISANFKTELLTNVISNGQLKASNNSKFLVSAKRLSSKGNLTLFDFDANTGLVTGINTILDEPAQDTGFYGAEFSPNDSFVYTTTKIAGGNADLRRYRTYGGANQIPEFISVIGANGQPGTALQLGPDGRIYHTQAGFFLRNLNYIENPNTNSPSFVFDGVLMDPAAGTLYGLPNIFNYWAYSTTFDKDYIGGDTLICSGSSVVLGKD